MNTEQALLARVVAGDPAARQQMAEDNMHPIMRQVDSFLRIRPGFRHLRDDLISAGLVGLTQAMNRLMKGGHNRCLHGLFWTIIARELNYLLESEQTIKVPCRSRRFAQQRGECLVSPTVERTSPETFTTPGYSDVDIRDLMASCCLGREDHIFLAMREARYTYAEIANATGQPLTSTYAAAQALEARVYEKLENL